MKISEIKKLLRDMCRILDHERGKWGKCTRCKKDLGFIGWEIIGMRIHNAKGVTKINIE